MVFILVIVGDEFRVEVLLNGVDDYFVKFFKFKEFIVCVYFYM